VTETFFDLHKYRVLDSEAQDLFREARTPNTVTDEPLTDAQLEAVYDLLRFAPTSMNQQPLRMLVVRSDEARARLAAHMGERNREKTASAPVSVVLAAGLDFHENLPVLFPHVPNARDTFADPVARAESGPVQRGRAGRLLRPRGQSGGAGGRPTTRVRRRRRRPRVLPRRPPRLPGRGQPRPTGSPRAVAPPAAPRIRRGHHRRLTDIQAHRETA
jgi:nitroreductase